MTREVTLIQTGGQPDDKIIVKMVDGYPEVFAFITDVELDVFKVTFEGEFVFDFDTESLSYIKLDAFILSEVALLCVEAEPIVNEINERLLDCDETEIEPDFSDLLTNHELVAVKEEVAENLAKDLGVAGVAPQAKRH